jgi:hypothetical protein
MFSGGSQPKVLKAHCFSLFPSNIQLAAKRGQLPEPTLTLVSTVPLRDRFTVAVLELHISSNQLKAAYWHLH